MDTITTDRHGVDSLERETIRRVAWRLIPLLMLGYFCNYLDRVNVGMAGPTMRADLGFSNAMFGFGAGLFSIGYLLATVPNTLMVHRFGARRWLARILLTWGIVSALTAFVWNDWSFYTVRILLGLSEAGFYPGVVLYLTWWFPSYYRSRMMATFASITVVCLFIGQPISGLILELNGMLGLHGWQWLFLFEALPPIIMGIMIWRFLTDRPKEAAWLRPEQRIWLSERLAAERAQSEAVHKYSVTETFCDVKVWLLALTDFGFNMANYGVVIFLPMIVKGLGVATNMVGLVSAVPYVFALVGMIFWGWHSDYTGERIWHVITAALVCSGGLVICSLVGTGHPVMLMAAITLAVIGAQTATPLFWALPAALLTGAAAAGGIGMINAVSNLGGFFGPWTFGLVKDATGSDNIALLALAVSPIVSVILLLIVGHDRRQEGVAPRA